MVSANDVKELRERTGAGMMDCKNALTEAEGDIEKAVEILREKGLAAAAKKSGRIAAEGIVESHISNEGRIGVLVEVNCETDFVAKTPEFKAFVHDIAEHIAEAKPESVICEKASADCCLMEQPFVKGREKKIKDIVNEKISVIGENISVRRFVRYEAEKGLVESYIHGGGRIGVLVEVTSETEAAAKKPEFKAFVHDIAMQIAASKPEFVVREEVSPEIIEKEKQILRTQALNEGKPEKIVDRMVEGRIEKYFKESCLMEQPFVKDPEKSVKALVKEVISSIGENISIRRFARYEVGEGLQKREENFAEEVMKQMK
jgi:elongation factor Ts